MKKALVLALILLMGLTAFNGVVLAGGSGIPDGAVMQKQFPIQNLPTPKVIQYFNKVIDMGNNLKGEMLIGKDEQAFFEVWKPNSGKRDVYVWNGTSWEYKYSITHIVPGFEKPATLNTYKYANWREYTNHKVQMDDGNTPTPPPSNSLTVTLTGPDKLSVNEQGTYTAHISGGVSPFTLTWSSDGYVSQSGVNAYYKWAKTGTYTVTVLVRDGAGNTASASKDVDVVPPYDFTLTSPDMLLFVEDKDGAGTAGTTGALFEIYVTDLTKTLKSVEVTGIKINGHDWTKYFGREYNWKWDRKVPLNNGIGSAVFIPWHWGWLTGIPLGDNNVVQVTVKFTDDVSITKSITVPIKYAKSVSFFDIETMDVMMGTVEKHTYDYYVWSETVDTVQQKYVISIHVKKVTSDKYHNNVEEVLNDPNVKEAISELTDNPNSADATGTGEGVDYNAFSNATQSALDQVGAKQETSDNVLIESGNLTGVVADSNGTTVHPHINTSGSIPVSFVHSEEVRFDNWELNNGSLLHSYDNPDLLKLMTVVKLPKHPISDNCAITEPGDYAAYELPPKFGDLLLSGITDERTPINQWFWNKTDRKWIFKVDLNEPKTLPEAGESRIWILYTNNHDTIRGIISSKPSIDVNTVKDGIASDEASIWYVLTTGKYINPTGGPIIKEVKDSSGNLIAYATLNGVALQVIGVKKGTGTLNLTKDDLQGPFGISLPVTVSAISDEDKTLIDFKVGDKDYHDLGSEHWLKGYDWNKSNGQGHYEVLYLGKNWGSFEAKKSLYKEGAELVYSDPDWYGGHNAPYSLYIQNTGKVPLILKIDYDHYTYSSPDNPRQKTVTYTVKPGHGINCSDIITEIVNTWTYGIRGNRHRSTKTLKISYEVGIKIGSNYFVVKKGADAITIRDKR